MRGEKDAFTSIPQINSYVGTPTQRILIVSSDKERVVGEAPSSNVVTGAKSTNEEGKTGSDPAAAAQAEKDV